MQTKWQNECSLLFTFYLEISEGQKGKLRIIRVCSRNEFKISVVQPYFLSFEIVCVFSASH